MDSPGSYVHQERRLSWKDRSPFLSKSCDGVSDELGCANMQRRLLTMIAVDDGVKRKVKSG